MMGLKKIGPFWRPPQGSQYHVTMLEDPMPAIPTCRPLVSRGKDMILVHGANAHIILRELNVHFDRLSVTRTGRHAKPGQGAIVCASHVAHAIDAFSHVAMRIAAILLLRSSDELRDAAEVAYAVGGTDAFRDVIIANIDEKTRKRAYRRWKKIRSRGAI